MNNRWLYFNLKRREFLVMKCVLGKSAWKTRSAEVRQRDRDMIWPARCSEQEIKPCCSQKDFVLIDVWNVTFLVLPFRHGKINSAPVSVHSAQPTDVSVCLTLKVFSVLPGGKRGRCSSTGLVYVFSVSSLTLAPSETQPWPCVPSRTGSRGGPSICSCWCSACAWSCGSSPSPAAMWRRPSRCWPQPRRRFRRRGRKGRWRWSSRTKWLRSECRKTSAPKNPHCSVSFIVKQHYQQTPPLILIQVVLRQLTITVQLNNIFKKKKFKNEMGKKRRSHDYQSKRNRTLSNVMVLMVYFPKMSSLQSLQHGSIFPSRCWISRLLLRDWKCLDITLECVELLRVWLVHTRSLCVFKSCRVYLCLCCGCWGVCMFDFAY